MAFIIVSHNPPGVSAFSIIKRDNRHSHNERHDKDDVSGRSSNMWDH